MGQDHSSNHDIDVGAQSVDAIKEEAATRVQALARGRLVRKDTMVQKMRGEIMLRTNLPARWRTIDGVPAGIEVEQRRFLAIVGQHLIVFKMRFFGMSRKVGRAEFVIDANRIESVHRDAVNPAVFAVGMGDGQRDRLFRAPDEATCEKWVRALILSVSRIPRPRARRASPCASTACVVTSRGEKRLDVPKSARMGRHRIRAGSAWGGTRKSISFHELEAHASAAMGGVDGKCKGASESALKRPASTGT
ncbi:hypothetical protein KFE25_002911 [Diacronema lutheri]|uniref:PH domain-containing protein n=1 Tax=Diacronema lutheri TaxID=2081491 RepID=A0A8J5XS89_DIALT|nr:hypothetical protein KFE25_002911 [Diacronema lutheri]